MSEWFSLFPQAPLPPAATQHSLPVCEWIMPAPATRRRDYARLCKVLPPGMPDCLRVSILRVQGGSERCTAAIYGAQAYLIHYAFMPAP